MLRKGVPMARKRRQYSREFKLEAVKMVVEQDRTVKDVAEGLGIDRSLLQGWKKQFLEDGSVAFPGHGRLKPDAEELRALHKELSRVRQERDILKKALAYFANDKI